MSIFSKIGKGISNTVKAVGKGIGNAAEWTWDNKGKVLGTVAGVAGATVGLGAVAPGLASGIIDKLGNSKVGSVVGKVMQSGVVINSKIKDTLGKNGLPTDARTTQEMSDYIKSEVERKGLTAIESKTLGSNHSILQTIGQKLPTYVQEAGELFGINTTNPEYSQATIQAQAAASASSGLGMAGLAMSQANQMMAFTAANSKNQSSNESAIDKLIAMKMLDSNTQQNQPEKESFIEKMMMMKELNKQDTPAIQPQTTAQMQAFQQVQADLNQTKLEMAMDKNNPNKVLYIIGVGIAVLGTIFAIIFSKKR